MRHPDVKCPSLPASPPRVALGPSQNPSNPDPSIFGNTYGGVPNPMVPVYQAYPTRYHGQNTTTPVFGHPYVTRPYMAPFRGKSGSMGAPVDDATSGVRALAFIAAGAGLSYWLTKKPNKKTRNALIGGVATGFLGGLGLVGSVILSVADPI